MTTQTHDTLTELRDFVETQAAEDAVLPAGERSYQADLVKDVLGQELKPAQARELANDYSEQVTSHLGTKQIAA